MIERRFIEAYQAHSARIYRYCLFRTGSRQEAEDLTAEVFRLLLETRRPPEDEILEPWLLRVARNLCINYQRRQSRHRLRARALGGARPEAAAAEWAVLDESLTLTGWGLVRHGDTIRTALRPEVRIAAERMWVPDGASLIHAAWSQSGPGSLATIARLDRVEALAAAHPAVLLPVYTRLSDAEEAEVRAGGLRVPPAGGVAGPGGGGASCRSGP